MKTSSRGGSFVAFILGLSVGAALTVFVMHHHFRSAASPAEVERTALPTTPPPAAQPPPASSADDALTRKLREWKLDPENLRRELEHAGDVIKREGKRLGDQLGAATSDVRIVAVIKARYTLDDGLSAWNIVVACKDGHVTLAGSVDSPELIGRAIVLALDTDGVLDVVSSLRVKTKTQP
jgi:hypothetical protein